MADVFVGPVTQVTGNGVDRVKVQDAPMKRVSDLFIESASSLCL